MMRAGVALLEDAERRIAALAAEAKSVALVEADGVLVGLIALDDTMRPELPAALEALRNLGVRRLLLLTGHRRQVGEAVTRQLGVEVAAEMLPADKIQRIAELQRQGHVVAMVGDGSLDTGCSRAYRHTPWCTGAAS